MPQCDTLYQPPRPRGRPPLDERRRNRLTLKLTGAIRGGASDSRPEIEEAEAQLEEQFVIRVLPSMAERFNKHVNERTINDALEVTFRDARNATIRFESKHYTAKLVDLPTITEAYRTLDKKQLLKTADICQMLVVESEIDERESSGPLPVAYGVDLIHPDGIMPPFRDVRRRRFRKRIPESRVDAIEREVLRLLEEDSHAMSVKCELYDDDNGQDESGARGAATPSIDILSPVTTMDEIVTTPLIADDDDDDDAANSVANDELEFDENLAAELAQGLEELEDEPEDDEDEESEDEEQPNSERSMQMKLLSEEIAELEKTVKKKSVDLGSAPNPIIRKRFDDIIQRLMLELEIKKEQLEKYTKEIEAEAAAEEEGKDNSDKA